MGHRWIGVVACFVVFAMTPPLAGHPDGSGGKGNLEGGGGAQGGPFAASNIDLLGHLTQAMLGGTTPVIGSGGVRGNDIWGWTDPLNNEEYALVGRSDGTAFVNIADPVNPVYLGILPSHTGNSAWRDIKTYQDYAYIGSDGNGSHGIQIFDLTQLRGLTGPPIIFSETTHYSGITESHNIAINGDTGWAYAVGANTHLGGVHFLDLTDPLNPVNPGGATGYSGDGYTHDAQAVLYNGPDTDHQGKEILFAFNEDTVTIVDIDVKSAPVQLSRTGYPNSQYVHQGWITEDQRYILQNDEFDERNNPSIFLTRTHIWDAQNLDNPIYLGFYEASVGSIDHNLYIDDGFAYMANYTTGLRVLDLDDIASANLTEVAWIDTHPSEDSLTEFDGAWSNYPYFESGAVVIGDRDEGLLIVQLNILPGDTQTDHRVDLVDMTTVAAHWLTSVNAGYMEADFNHDDFVDQLDLDLMEANWDDGVAGMTFGKAMMTVGLPEPATVTLLGLSALLFLTRPQTIH